MMRTLIGIIAIVVLIPLSTDCQDSVVVRRALLEKLAMQMDSFDVLKLKEMQYLNYMAACDSLATEQGKIIVGLDTVIYNQERQLMMFSDIENERHRQLKANTDYIKKLEKMNKGHKIRNKIFLIGGGVLTVGLTTALIISLLN